MCLRICVWQALECKLGVLCAYIWLAFEFKLGSRRNFSSLYIIDLRLCATNCFFEKAYKIYNGECIYISSKCLLDHLCGSDENIMQQIRRSFALELLGKS